MTRLEPSVELPVSIVVPLYHGEKFYPALKESLLGQGPCEVVLVIDDDSSLEGIRDLVSELTCAKIEKTTGSIGTALARNAGAGLASRDYLLFLDQDDQLPWGFVHALLSHGRGTVAYDNEYVTLGPSGAVRSGTSVFGRAGWTGTYVDRSTSRSLIKGFPMLKLLVPTGSFAAVGGYRPFLGVEDFDLVWRLVAMGETIKIVFTPSGMYMLHEASTTRTIALDSEAFVAGRRTWRRIYRDMSAAKGLPSMTRSRARLVYLKLSAQVVMSELRDGIRDLGVLRPLRSGAPRCKRR